MIKRENFEFAGETFNLGEEVIIVHKEPGYPGGKRDYIGAIEYISQEYKTQLSGLNTDIKLDSRKHMMGLNHIEKIERVTDEKRRLLYQKENEQKKILNTKYKRIEIFLKESDNENCYVITCDGEECGNGDTLQKAIENFDRKYNNQ